MMRMRTAEVLFVVAGLVLASVLAFPARARADQELLGYIVEVPHVDDNVPRPDANHEPGALSVIDLRTGDTTKIGDTGERYISGLSFGPDGTLYGINDVQMLVEVDPSTAVTTLIGTTEKGDGLTFDCAGRLWMAGRRSTAGGEFETLSQLDPTTGATISSVTLDDPSVSDLEGLAVRGSTIFGTALLDGNKYDFAPGAWHLVSISESTGQVSVIGQLQRWADALTVDHTGTVWAHASNWANPSDENDPEGWVFAIDPETAEQSRYRTVDIHGDSLAIPGGPWCPDDTDSNLSSSGSTGTEPAASPLRDNGTGRSQSQSQAAGGVSSASAPSSDTDFGGEPSTGEGQEWVIADRAPTGTGVHTPGGVSTSGRGGVNLAAGDRSDHDGASSEVTGGFGSSPAVLVLVLSVVTAIAVVSWKRQVCRRGG